MLNIKAHMNNIALPHLIFALPFAYMSMLLAAEGVPSFHDAFWVTLAIFGGRSAALALNNLVDYDYDRLQPRFTGRALVRGDITKHGAKISVGIYLIVLFVSVAQLRPICLLLLPVAVVPFVVYPFTKRFTSLCHLVLGVAIAMAPGGAWVAVRGDVTTELVVLCAAVALWIGAFDAVYGAQDENFDRLHGLHSMATAFSAKGTLIITKIMHLFSIILFVIAGVIINLPLPYFIGVGIAAAVLYYQHRIVKPNDFRQVTQKYFMRNGIVSVAMLVFTWLCYV